MGKIKIKHTRTTYRKSKSHPKNCPTCGRFWKKK